MQLKISIKAIPHRDCPPFLTKQTCRKIARTSKLSSLKQLAFTVFGQIKRIAHVSFSYFTFNAN